MRLTISSFPKITDYEVAKKSLEFKIPDKRPFYTDSACWEEGVGGPGREMLEAGRALEQPGSTQVQQATLVHRLEEQQSHGTGSNMACALVVVPLCQRRARLTWMEPLSFSVDLRAGMGKGGASLWRSIRE